MSYSPKFIPRLYLETKQFPIVYPNTAPSIIFIKTDIYKLNQTLDYKLNKNFINGIQQIRMGSSWNLNQTSLVAHGNQHHY